MTPWVGHANFLTTTATEPFLGCHSEIIYSQTWSDHFNFISHSWFATHREVFCSKIIFFWQFLCVCWHKSQISRHLLPAANWLTGPFPFSIWLHAFEFFWVTQAESGFFIRSEVLTSAMPIPSFFQVLTHINKDKQKTEGQVQIFKIFSDIENCPPLLISSHRRWIISLQRLVKLFE